MWHSRCLASLEVVDAFWSTDLLRRFRLISAYRNTCSCISSCLGSRIHINWNWLVWGNLSFILWRRHYILILSLLITTTEFLGDDISLHDYLIWSVVIRSSCRVELSMGPRLWELLFAFWVQLFWHSCLRWHGFHWAFFRRRSQVAPVFLGSYHRMLTDRSSKLLVITTSPIIGLHIRWHVVKAITVLHPFCRR